MSKSKGKGKASDDANKASTLHVIPHPFSVTDVSLLGNSPRNNTMNEWNLCHKHEHEYNSQNGTSTQGFRAAPSAGRWRWRRTRVRVGPCALQCVARRKPSAPPKLDCRKRALRSERRPRPRRRAEIEDERSARWLERKGCLIEIWARNGSRPAEAAVQERGRGQTRATRLVEWGRKGRSRKGRESGDNNRFFFFLLCSCSPAGIQVISADQYSALTRGSLVFILFGHLTRLTNHHLCVYHSFDISLRSCQRYQTVEKPSLRLYESHDHGISQNYLECYFLFYQGSLRDLIFPRISKILRDARHHGEERRLAKGRTPNLSQRHRRVRVKPRAFRQFRMRTETRLCAGFASELKNSHPTSISHFGSALSPGDTEKVRALTHSNFSQAKAPGVTGAREACVTLAEAQRFVFYHLLKRSNLLQAARR